ncbi:MAG: cyanophycinase, partial [Anaerolineaceae bacterium]|nr:cyanophycinase [Anaerolineaceae bacterium]
MRALSKLLSLILLASFCLGSPLSSRSAKAQKAVETILIPIGGGYSDVYAGYMATVVKRAVAGKVKILVLPATYSTNPITITHAERQVNIRDAEARRYEIQEACKRAAPADVTCTAVLIPVFTREDADNLDNIKEFTPDLTAVFILGGDQTVAMRAIIGTKVEQALTDAYQSGLIVGGTSAGCGMLTVQMLAGYTANFAAENSLDFGSADMWTSTELRGLPFGIPNAILDQHFFQRARLTRLVNAILLPDVPHVGIGVDAYTGVNIYNQSTLRDVFGLYTVTILDAETYHSADAVQYRGPGNTLSLRNVLVHLLAPGNFSYDLGTRRHSYQPYPSRLARNFDALKLPRGAGRLLLAGDLSSSLENSP